MSSVTSDGEPSSGRVGPKTTGDLVRRLERIPLSTAPFSFATGIAFVLGSVPNIEQAESFPTVVAAWLPTKTLRSGPSRCAQGPFAACLRMQTTRTPWSLKRVGTLRDSDDEQGRVLSSSGRERPAAFSKSSTSPVRSARYALAHLFGVRYEYDCNF